VRCLRPLPRRPGRRQPLPMCADAAVGVGHRCRGPPRPPGTAQLRSMARQAPVWVRPRGPGPRGRRGWGTANGTWPVHRDPLRPRRRARHGYATRSAAWRRQVVGMSRSVVRATGRCGRSPAAPAGSSCMDLLMRTHRGMSSPVHEGHRDDGSRRPRPVRPITVRVRVRVLRAVVVDHVRDAGDIESTAATSVANSTSILPTRNARSARSRAPCPRSPWTAATREAAEVEVLGEPVGVALGTREDHRQPAPPRPAGSGPRSPSC